MHNKANLTRRTLLKGIAVAPVAVAFVHHQNATAAQIDENDPQAKSLGYKHVSSQAGKTCANCRLWKGGDAAWGACAILPGKDVANGGYCNAWAGV